MDQLTGIRSEALGERAIFLSVAAVLGVEELRIRQDGGPFPVSAHLLALQAAILGVLEMAPERIPAGAIPLIADRG
ncbi:MAG: hypothetical protein ACLPVF_16550 [Acidimicrobiales bacterium]